MSNSSNKFGHNNGMVNCRPIAVCLKEIGIGPYRRGRIKISGYNFSTTFMMQNIWEGRPVRAKKKLENMVILCGNMVKEGGN